MMTGRDIYRATSLQYVCHKALNVLLNRIFLKNKLHPSIASPLELFYQLRMY